MESIFGVVIGLFLILFIPLQIIFAIIIKIEVFKLRKKDRITEKEASGFLKRMRYVLWVPYTTKYFSRMREAYRYIYESPLVSFETKRKVHKSLKWRLVKGIPAPKEYQKIS
ncbi:hypothetical protein [Alkalihalobacterium sp. APHAB7]|uniref:hypothetical protein n=1 Tax=Alkalihalobacterium sp. APHAB7 TaxID=3402081 RepID=UPI003AABD046